MTDATDLSMIPRVRRQAAEALPLPHPVPFGAPVLISDCASPLAGETLLSLLWKRMDGADQDALKHPPRRDPPVGTGKGKTRGDRLGRSQVRDQSETGRP